MIELAVALQWPPASVSELDEIELATLLDVLEARRS
jgi:hypothetical protein